MQQKPSKLPSKAGTELGTSGTLIFGGIITEEEYSRDLYGLKKYKVFDIMRKSDASIRQALQVVKLPLRSAPWGVKPVKQKDGSILPLDQEKADFINRELFSRAIEFDEFLSEATSMFDFGFSLFEIIYGITQFEGRTFIGVDKLGFRKQKTVYAWETQEGKPGITQMTGIDTASIPREKMIYFTFDKEGDNYEGTSLLRYAYKDFDIKDKVVLVNAMSIERHGMGVMQAKATDPKVTPAPQDIIDAKDIMRNTRANQNSHTVTPNTLDISMMDMKTSSTKDAVPTMRYHDTRIAKSVLAGFLEIGGDAGSGAQSLATELSSLFMKSEEGAAKVIRNAIQKDLINRLCDLNYSDNSGGYPKLDYGQISDDDINGISTFVQSLGTAGFLTPDAETEAYLRKVARLPEMSESIRKRYEAMEDGDAPIDSPVKKTDVTITKKEEKELEKAKDIKAAISQVKQSREILLGALAQG